jgi:hypothetical protein
MTVCAKKTRTKLSEKVVGFQGNLSKKTPVFANPLIIKKAFQHSNKLT